MKRRKPTNLKRLASQVNKVSKKKPEKIEDDNQVDFISTGCIPLNLALSQRSKEGGIARGRVVNFVGDKSSGKTLLTLETCHSAYRSLPNKNSDIWPDVKNLDIFYNSSEGQIDFPIAKMYGADFARDIDLQHIDTIEAWGRKVLRKAAEMKKGDCLIAVLDSLDNTKSSAQKRRTEEAVRKDKEEEGSYNLEKPKYLSKEFFPAISEEQKTKDITLIIISQIRENLDAGLFGKRFRRNGGKALDHDCHQILWLYSGSKLKKSTLGHECVYGVNVRAEVEKNKSAPPFREARFPILFNYGIDDVKSMIAFLNGPERKTIEWRGEKISVEELMRKVKASDKAYNRLVRMTEELWFKVERIMENEREIRRPKF